MNGIKFKITKMDQEMFFLRVGAIVYVDFDDNRVWSEDRKQYMPLNLAEKLGIDGVQV